jgi:hypothetical protein
LSSPGWAPTLPTMPQTDHDSFTKILQYVA